MKRCFSMLEVGVLAAMTAFACSSPERRTGDVKEIRGAGELRVVTRPGFLTAPRVGDGGDGEAAILTELASRIGVGVRWIEAERHDQVLRMVRDGLADIGVNRFSPAALLHRGIRGTVAVDWVEDLLVAGRNSPFDGFESVSGATVHIHRSGMTASLRSFLDEEGLTVEEVPEEVPIEEMLRRVRTGRYGLTIVDSRVAEREQAARRMEIIGPVAERRALVWAVREDSPRLRLAIDRFFFAERVLSGTTGEPACRDLKQIRDARVLRLVTRNSATTCRVERGGLEGFEYDLAVSFARSLRLRL
jgi:membrane-bound lytic murein transglycosylase F